LPIVPLHAKPTCKLSKEICKNDYVVFFNVHNLYANVSFCKRYWRMFQFKYQANKHFYKRMSGFHYLQNSIQ
jgi:hypothetical protein